jgi:hypothetical protein
MKTELEEEMMEGGEKGRGCEVSVKATRVSHMLSQTAKASVM